MYIRNKNKISIIGLGYVGLPLAIEFSKYHNVIGYDINKQRVFDLNNCFDINSEIKSINIKKAIRNNLIFTNDASKISNSSIYIITVPTPIYKNKKPNLTSIKNSTKLVGNLLKKNNIVIYESTVYPGLIEEICVPILRKQSGLKYNLDFFCGYSPERINPGDTSHNLKNIVKITSGSNSFIASKIDKLYKQIVKAGTYKASSIKVAEAAKVIENTQRDINIAFMNELVKIFYKLNIDSNEVFEAANTKWNFINFKPGLVGGHCIGVDPYYLTFQAKKAGFNSDIILSGRKVNDSMAIYLVQRLISEMKKRKITLLKPRILIMGLSFKENCSDIRNSKVFEIIDNLLTKNLNCSLFDPNIDHNLLERKYKSLIIKNPKKNKYDAIIIAVGHKIFKKIGKKNIRLFGKKECFVFDIKNIFKEKNFETL